MPKTLRTAANIAERFPHLPTEEIERIAAFNRRIRFGVSEEMLAYFQTDERGVPLPTDPLARRYWPFPQLLDTAPLDSYAGGSDNWEMPADFPIPGNSAWQWKYTDRICWREFRCTEFCLDCFEANRTLKKDSQKHPRKNDWSEGIAFIREHPQIREVILTGGEPLIVTDTTLKQRLADIRSVKHVETIRIHTARGIHDTDRLSDTFAGLCREFSVTEIALHILHSRQLTERFKLAMERMASGCGSTIRLAHIPVLLGVNDESGVQKELCAGLVRLGVKPYYWLHQMPSTSGISYPRLSVSHMVDVLRPLVGRGFSHMQCAEPIIVSRRGKKTVPMERTRFWLHESQVREGVWAIDNTQQRLEDFALSRQGDLLEFDGTPDFMYTTYGNQPVIVFKNWKGSWEMYPDAAE